MRYCPKCGARIEKGARFCVECGARLDGFEAVEKEETSPGEPASEGAAAGSPSLYQRMRKPMRIGRITVPTFVAILVALLLATGTAAAAVMVYRNVIQPAIERMQEQGEEEAEADAVADEGEAAEGDADAERGAVATGNPQSVLQLAEILAMDLGDVSGYVLGEQLAEVSVTDTSDYYVGGGTIYSIAGGFPVTDSALTYWEGGVGSASAAELVEDAGIALSEEPGEQTLSLYLGYNLTPSWYLCPDEYSAYDSTNLLGGVGANCIYLSGLAIEWLDEDSATALSELCGFGSAGESFSYVTTQGLGEEASYVYYGQAFVGTVEVNGSSYVWYIHQTHVVSDYGEYAVGTQIGCVSMDLAAWLVEYEGLGLYDQWGSATADERALMFAQSLVQDSQNGQDGLRENVLTGELESVGFDDEGRMVGTTVGSVEEYYESRH